MTLYTTSWGALYLAVLIVLMGPALLFPAKRWLALWMFFLWGIDRVSVSALPPDLALFFLAFAYTFVAIAARLTHSGRAATIMAAFLVITSLSFIAGGFGGIDWDTAGSVQEVSGLAAMLSIIWRRPDGARRGQRADVGAPSRRSGPAAGAAARRQSHK